MSSSYRKAARSAALILLSAPAFAQQTYFVPGVELRAEEYSNRELRPDSSATESSQAYKATLEARMGRATQRSDTEFRPRIVAQEISNRSGIDRVEAFADLNTKYRLPRSEYAFMANYSRQDTFNAEFGDPSVPDFNPDEPPPTDVPTGVIVAGLTRTKYLLEPSFSHELSQRMHVEGMLQFESVRYDSDLPNTRVGYDAPYAELMLLRSTGQRTHMGFGGYVSRYEPDNSTRNTDTHGVLFGVRHRWSEVSHVGVQLRVERNETDAATPGDATQSSTDWGVEFLGDRKGPVGQLRYSIGRFLRPSGLGSRRAADQIQLQYTRGLSERVRLSTAVRLQRDQSIGNSSVDPGNRDRAQAEISLERLLTRQWSLKAGYKFTWQDLGDAVDSANSHTGYLSIGYRALDPRRPVR